MSEQNGNGNGKTNAIVSAKDKRANIEKVLLNSKGSWAALLPKHIKQDAMLRSVMAAIAKTPDLLACSPASIVMATAQACALGLLPNTPLGLGYLIPFKSTATFVPGYKGLIRLAIQSGVVDNIETDVIHEHDAYEIHSGTDRRILHSISLDGERGKALAYYAVATLKTGAKTFEVMTKSDIDAIRTRSKASSDGPWVTDYDQMARKTVIRRLSNYLPLSEENILLQRALDLQAAAEAGEVDQSDVIDVVGEVVDPDSGEVLNEQAPSRSEALKDRVTQKASS